MAVCQKMCCNNGVKNDTSPLVPKKGSHKSQYQRFGPLSPPYFPNRPKSKP